MKSNQQRAPLGLRFSAKLRFVLSAALLALAGSTVGTPQTARASTCSGPYAPNADLSSCNLSGDNLTGANLVGANLSDANLTGADLYLATLTGARLTNVRWSNTTCPDGTNSNGDVGSCSGHLTLVYFRLAGDLHGVNLSTANLTGANVSGANLAGSNLSGARLVAGGLNGANLTGANLSGANLSHTSTGGAVLSNTVCPDGTNSDNNGLTCDGHLSLAGGLLAGADLEWADLSGTQGSYSVDLTGTDLSRANLVYADLVRATASGANLSGANLSWANLTKANVSGANLSSANLSGATSSGANLSGANLSSADLSAASVSGANFSGANLSSANLLGATLTNPILDNVRWSNTTCPDGSNSDSVGGTCLAHLSVPGAQPPGVKAPGVDLSGRDLEHANFAGADLSGALLTGAYLASLHTEGADLSGADLSGANLNDAGLGDYSGGTNLTGANLSGATLWNVGLGMAYLSNANLIGARFGGPWTDVSSAHWKNTTCPDGTNSDTVGGDCLGHLSLQHAMLQGVKLPGAWWQGAELSGINLINATLTQANLYAANLPGADLTGANLAGADLLCATLTGANLTGANLTGATILDPANPCNVVWSNTTCPDGTNSNSTPGQTCNGHLSLDTVPPTTVADLSPPANRAGWNKGDVTLTLSATDEPGGTGVSATWYAIDVASCGNPTGSVTGCQKYDGTKPPQITAEGTHTVYFFSVDGAGNAEAQEKSREVKIDKTPPTIKLSSRTAPNAHGWNNGPVIASWNCTDNLSGPVSAAVSTTLSAEGANQAATGTCVDLADNAASDTQTGFNIDVTAPTVKLATDVQSYTVDQTINFTCSAADTLSGMDSIACPAKGSGQSVNCSAAGTPTPSITCPVSAPASSYYVGPGDTTVTVTAYGTDLAGNQGKVSTTFTLKKPDSKSMSTLTWQFVQGSWLFQQLPPAQQAAVTTNVKTALAGLSQIPLTPAQVAAYQVVVKWLGDPKVWAPNPPLLTADQVNTLVTLSNSM